MEDWRGVNSRIAYMGQRVMENPLKGYYDEVISAALRSEQSQEQMLKKSDLRGRRFRSQGSQILEQYQRKERPSRIQTILPKSSLKDEELSHVGPDIKYSLRVRETQKRKSVMETIPIERVESQLVEVRPKVTNGFAALYQNSNSIRMKNVPTPKHRQWSLRERPTVGIQRIQGENKNMYSERPRDRVFQPLEKMDQPMKKISQIKPKFKQRASITQSRDEPQIELQMPGSRRSKRYTRHSFRSLRDSTIQFLKPTVSRKEETRMKLKRCLFAVYWLCCQTKQIRRKMNERKSKHTILFNKISQSIYSYVSEASIGLFKPVVKKIRQFKHQGAMKQNSKVYLMHMMEVQKSMIGVLPHLKAILIKDKYTKSILRVLIREREHFPNGYLTQYQLDRIEVSKMFMYPVKTFGTCVILLLTFILVRVLILQILVYPIRLDPDFHSNPVWNQIVEDLKCYLYVQTLEMVEEEVEEGQFFDKKGNWSSIPPLHRYKPRCSFLSDSHSSDSLISSDWDFERANEFKNKLPNNWQLLKDSLQQWIYQLYDDLKLIQTTQSITISSKMSSFSKHRTQNTLF